MGLGDLSRAKRYLSSIKKEVNQAAIKKKHVFASSLRKTNCAIYRKGGHNAVKRFKIKCVAFCCLIFCAPLMTIACAKKTSPLDPTYFEDGSYVSHSGNGQLSYSLKSLPFDMKSKDIIIPFERVTFFESYGNRGYTGYVVVALSRKNLTDDDIYWMTKFDIDKVNKELQVIVYLSSKDNDLDVESMSRINCVYDDDYLYYIFESDLQRYSLREGEVSCQIILTPTGTLEADTRYYYYSIDLDDEHYSDSLDVFTAAEIGYIIDALT